MPHSLPTPSLLAPPTPTREHGDAAPTTDDAAGLDRLMRWTVRVRAGLWAPFLIYAVTLAGPFVLDDLYMIRRVERYRAGEIATPSLFRFVESPEQLRAQRDRTSCPWWMGGGGTTRFFRPLPETAFLLDHLLFGRAVLGYRLMSMAWFLLTLLLVRRLYAAAGATSTAAELATLLFGTAQTVSSPAAFISNRSDLMVVVGLAAASIALWTSRVRDGETPRPIGRWLSLAFLAYAFALCSKEAAVSLAGVWIIHAWIERTERGAASKRRWMFALLAAVMAAGYLAFYFGNGYGTHVIGMSATERLTTQLRDSLRTAAFLLPVWMMGIPAMLFMVLNLEFISWLLFGLAVLVAIGVIARGRAEWRRSATFRFFVIWAAVMSLPALLATSEPRVLCVATVGWAYVVTRLFVVEREPVRGRIGRGLRAWVLMANGATTVMFGLGTILYMQISENACQASIHTYLAAQPRDLRDGNALIVTVPEHTLELLAPGDRLQMMTGRRDVRLHYLTVAGVADVVRRVEDDHTLLLTSAAPDFFGGLLHPSRADDGGPLRVGTKWETRDFTAEIAEMKADRVTSLRVRFARPLDSPEWLFYPVLKRLDR